MSQKQDIFQPAMQLNLNYPLEEENTTTNGQLKDNITLILTLGI